MRTDVRKKERERLHQLQQFADEYSASNKILQQLFRDPLTEYSLSELAELAGVSKSIASTVIQQLQEESVVTVLQLKYVYRIKANYEHFIYRQRKIVYNLDVIFRSGIVEEIVEAYGNPRAIVLFGSMRKGEDYAHSDIDIAVEVASHPSQGPVIESRPFLEEFLGRTLRVYVYTRESVPDHLFVNIANGILLDGVLEVRK